ncbi:hypothetical protein T459_01661 [Capsicum annuum]|uniref:Uncharacterized protein n=1 Tax=Capsicum annuum TaxID=4072 RepID=A0A2G3AHR6_CAPAN|nr:hypothetical protein T459_01661 [Capsicum annuum]
MVSKFPEELTGQRERSQKREEETSSQIRMLQEQFNYFIQTVGIIPPCPGDVVRASKGLSPWMISAQMKIWKTRTRSNSMMLTFSFLTFDTNEYFTLEDLWYCYDKWSSYGVGAPINLKEDHMPVIQYYAPTLSAIQIYTIKCPTTLSSCKNLSRAHKVDGNDSDKLSRTFNNNSSNLNIESMEYYPKNHLGYLYYQYSEVAAVKWRYPLVDKTVTGTEHTVRHECRSHELHDLNLEILCSWNMIRTTE